MSSGTSVKIERYYNRYHIHDLNELEYKLKKAIELREGIWGQIKALAMATPKDIVAPTNIPEEYITVRIEELRESLNNCEYDIQALYDIKEGWETREED